MSIDTEKYESIHPWALVGKFQVCPVLCYLSAVIVDNNNEYAREITDRNCLIVIINGMTQITMINKWSNDESMKHDTNHS